MAPPVSLDFEDVHQMIYISGTQNPWELFRSAFWGLSSDLLNEQLWRYGPALCSLTSPSGEPRHTGARVLIYKKYNSSKNILIILTVLNSEEQRVYISALNLFQYS